MPSHRLSHLWHLLHQPRNFYTDKKPTPAFKEFFSLAFYSSVFVRPTDVSHTLIRGPRMAPKRRGAFRSWVLLIRVIICSTVLCPAAASRYNNRYAGWVQTHSFICGAPGGAGHIRVSVVEAVRGGEADPAAGFPQRSITELQTDFIFVVQSRGNEQSADDHNPLHLFECTKFVCSPDPCLFPCAIWVRWDQLSENSRHMGDDAARKCILEF